MQLLGETFGLVPNTEKDSTFSMYQAIEKAAQEPGSVLTLTPGTYHFYETYAPEQVSCVSNHDNDGFKKIGAYLYGMDGFTLDGAGSVFIYHGIMNPFTISFCNNITIKNITIDFPLPFYAHATVVESRLGECLLQIAPGVPYFVEHGKLYFKAEGLDRSPALRVMEIDPAIDNIAYESNDLVFGNWFRTLDLACEDKGGGQIALTGEMARCPQKGHQLLFGFGERYAPGFFLEESSRITLESITIHHCLGMGVLAQCTRDITLKKVAILPSQGRFISAYADGVHFVHCSGEILLDGCNIQKQMDDPLNCHGIYAQIDQLLDSRTLLVKLVHEQQLGVPLFSEEDQVEFINHDSLLPISRNTVKAVKNISRQYTLLTFEEDLPDQIRVKDCVESVEACPNLAVINSYFGKNRARGLLITTRGKVVVENNTFECNGAAIKISGDANYWFESGCVRDVAIRNNTFINCNTNSGWGKCVIDIDPEIEQPDEKAGCYHENIIIENNVFRTFDVGLLWAKSVKNLVFRNNLVEQTADFPPKGTITERITTIACDKVTIQE